MEKLENLQETVNLHHHNNSNHTFNKNHKIMNESSVASNNHNHVMIMEKKKKEEEEKFDPIEFQAQLDLSLGNIYRTVESWIPSHLRSINNHHNHTPSPHPSSVRIFQPIISSKQTRLSIGPKSLTPGSSSTNHDIRTQILSKKRRIEKDEKEKIESQDIRRGKEKEEDQEEEESRTLTLFTSKSSKRPDLFKTLSSTIKPHPSISILSEPQIPDLIGTLSKKQLKKRRKLERLRLTLTTSLEGNEMGGQMDTQNEKTTSTGVGTHFPNSPPEASPDGSLPCYSTGQAEEEQQESKRKRKKPKKRKLLSILPTPSLTSGSSTPSDILHQACQQPKGEEEQEDNKSNEKEPEETKGSVDSTSSASLSSETGTLRDFEQAWNGLEKTKEQVERNKKKRKNRQEKRSQKQQQQQQQPQSVKIILNPTEFRT